MRKWTRIAVVVAVLFCVTSPLVEAKGSKAGTKTTHTKTSTKKDGATKTEPSKPASTQKSKAAVARDEKGRIQRSDAARHAFARQTGFPHGRPGYVIDHIIPLACGGADAPSNMQWQSVAAAKAKDKVERRGC